MCRNLISGVPNDGFLLNALKRAVQYAKKKENNLFIDSVTTSSAFATLISMKQGEKTQKTVAKYICDRLRESGERLVNITFIV